MGNLLRSAVVVVALVIAGCGDDDDEPSPTGTAAEEETVETEAPAEEEPVETEAPLETDPPPTEAPATDPPPTEPSATDPTSTEPSANGEAGPEVATATNGGTSANCTALTATNIECAPPAAPEPVEPIPECEYALDYPSTVPDVLRLQSLGIQETGDGLVIYWCSGTGVWSGDLDDDAWPAGWRITMTIGEPSTPDTALFVEYDAEAFFGFTNGLGAGFAVPQSYTNAGEAALAWLPGQPVDDDPSRLTLFYSGPDGTEEAVTIQLTPEMFAATSPAVPFAELYPEAIEITFD